MDQAIIEYVTDKIANDVLNAPQNITPSVAKALYSSEELRRGMHGKITMAHFDRLRQLCESGDIAVQAFSIDLLSPIIGQPQVQAFLEGHWKTMNLGVDAQRGVQFRLSDCADLSKNLHQELRDWNFQNWDMWLAGVSRFAGGPDAVLNFFKQRLEECGEGRRYPASKRWIYVCCAASSSQGQEARAYIEEFTNDADPFVAETARMVLERL